MLIVICATCEQYTQGKHIPNKCCDQEQYQHVDTGIACDVCMLVMDPRCKHVAGAQQWGYWQENDESS